MLESSCGGESGTNRIVRFKAEWKSAEGDSPRRSGFLSAFALVGRCRAVVLVEVVLFDVMNHRDGDQVSDAHVTSQEQTDLGAADVILDKLLDDMDVFLPCLQGSERFVNVGSGAFHDESLGRELAEILEIGMRSGKKHTPYFPRMWSRSFSLQTPGVDMVWTRSAPASRAIWIGLRVPLPASMPCRTVLIS